VPKPDGYVERERHENHGEFHENSEPKDFNDSLDRMEF
jgi:hypothetical protein